ncbi:MAG: MauE/DoxX family redox-associated membrane protein [Bacteroidota bacterium]
MLKNKNKNLEGKSLLFNGVFILLNLLGLTFLIFGYHPSFENSALGFQIAGYALFILSLIAIYIFEGWLLFAYLARILVGGLFIVSGLIKANDPKGFAYKLEEYFEDGALAYRVKELFNWESFSLEFLIDQALMLSVIICILEILLGALIILGRKVRLASWLMLAMMVFFTLLTWHTKECDPNSTFTDVDQYALEDPVAQAKIPQAEHDENISIIDKTGTHATIREVKKPQCVDDCGCFGDAMKGSIGRSLTPAESYWKDIVLLYLVVILFISRRRITPNTLKENTVLVFLSLLFVALFAYIFSWAFPILFALVILLLALWIRKTGGKLLGNSFGMTTVILLISALFVTYVLMYRPLKDYRPYHVDSNLIERMNDGEEGIYESILIYKNKDTGQDTTLTDLDESTENIWGQPEKWEFVERTTKTVEAGRLPSIQQFNPVIAVEELTNTERSFDYISQKIEENREKFVDIIEKSSGNRYPQPLSDFYQEDWDTSEYVIGDTIMRLPESFSEVSLKDYILQQEQIILIISKDLENGNFNRVEQLKKIAEQANQENIDMIMITASNADEIEAFRASKGLDIPTVQNDEIEIKAITRSNPTLMVLKKGVVKGKYAFRSTPSWKWLVKNVLEIK